MKVANNENHVTNYVNKLNLSQIIIVVSCLFYFEIYVRVGPSNRVNFCRKSTILWNVWPQWCSNNLHWWVNPLLNRWHIWFCLIFAWSTRLQPLLLSMSNTENRARTFKWPFIVSVYHSEQHLADNATLVGVFSYFSQQWLPLCKDYIWECYLVLWRWPRKRSRRRVSFLYNIFTRNHYIYL